MRNGLFKIDNRSGAKFERVLSTNCLKYTPSIGSVLDPDGQDGMDFHIAENKMLVSILVDRIDS